MKTYILSLLTLFTALNVTGQQLGKATRDNWTIVTSQLAKKADLAMNVVSIASEYKTIDQEMLNKTKAYALVLNKSLQLNTGPDSIVVDIIRRRNEGLTMAVQKLIAQLESDKKFKNSIELSNYSEHLSTLETKLVSSIANYNNAAEREGRTDLLYKVQGTRGQGTRKAQGTSN